MRLKLEVGERRGRLTVLEKYPSVPNTTHVLCRCDCGTEKKVSVRAVALDLTKSCGCLATDTISCMTSARNAASGLKLEPGSVYNRLTVVSQKTRWVTCTCSCGKTVVAEATRIAKGKVKSCGCYMREQTSKANKGQTHRRKPPGVHAFNNLIYIYKHYCAKKRGYSFELTDEQFRELTSKNCTYCGIEPRQRLGFVTGEVLYNGLDRVDSSKGYTLDNVVTCCKNCNRAKRNFSLDGFTAWVNRISTREWKVELAPYEPFSGVKNKSGYYPGEASFNNKFKSYRDKCAKGRGHSFELSVEQFKQLTSSPCYYCGRAPSNESGLHTTRYRYSGLDRLDNAKGYTLENAVPCCKECNSAKSDLSLSEFKDWVARLLVRGARKAPN